MDGRGPRMWRGKPSSATGARRFLSLCRKHGLPKPEVNVRVGPYEVDFLWRGHRLIVETDGYATHGVWSMLSRERIEPARAKEPRRFQRPVLHDQRQCRRKTVAPQRSPDGRGPS